MNKVCFVQRQIVLPYLPKPLAEYLIQKVMSDWMYKYITSEVNEACTFITLRKTVYPGDIDASIERDLNQIKTDLEVVFYKAKELSHMLSEVYDLYPAEKPKGWRKKLINFFSYRPYER